MNLFQLGQQYQELAGREDLDPTVLTDTLDSIDDTWTEKANNIAKWIESLDADVEWLTKKKRSISDELTYRKNLRANLMTYLTSAIDDRGLKEVHTDDYILRPRNYKASVVISNPDKLPMTFVHTETKTISRPDKKALYAALKAGQEVPAAKLVPNRRTVIN